jgi:four helix bundle protein
MFKFENLDVWKVSLGLYRKIAEASRTLKRRDHQFLIEQIMRATLSISANIAEGTGGEGVRESKQFFNCAKGSVYEVGIAHVLRQEGVLPVADFSEVYALCDRIAGMLSGLNAKR